MTIIQHSTLELAEDVPQDAPPPYTPSDTNASYLPSPILSQRISAVPGSEASLRRDHLEPLSPGASHTFSDSSIPSALAYFLERGIPARIPSPVKTINKTIRSSVSRRDFTFPFSVLDSTARDVTEQDWATFTNFVLSTLGKDSGSPGAKGRDNTLLSTEELSNRQWSVDQVISEWNEGFWQPRGIHVAVNYDYEVFNTIGPGCRTITNANGDIIGVAPHEEKVRTPQAELPGQLHTVTEPHAELDGGITLPPHSINLPPVPILSDPSERGIRTMQNRGPFSWARSFLGRGNGASEVVTGLEQSRDEATEPNLMSQARTPRPLASQRSRQRSSSVHSNSSAVSTSSSRSDKSTSSSASGDTLSSVDSEELTDAEFEILRGAVAALRANPESRSSIVCNFRELQKELRDAHRNARTGLQNSNSKETREARKLQIKSFRSELKLLRKEIHVARKEVRKKKKAERKAAWKERKVARKERRQARRNRGPGIPAGYRESEVLFEMPHKGQIAEKEQEPITSTETVQVTGVVDKPPTPPPTYHTFVPDDKTALAAREHEQVSSVMSSLGLSDTTSEITGPTIFTPATTLPPASVRSFSPPRPTSSHSTFRSSPPSPSASTVTGYAPPPGYLPPQQPEPIDTQSLNDTLRARAEDDRERALARAAEDRMIALERAMRDRENAAIDRERALTRAAEDKKRGEERAMKDRERALHRAAEDRERAREQAARDRNRAADERNRALERASRDRVRALERAQGERTRAEERIRMRKERLAGRFGRVNRKKGCAGSATGEEGAPQCGESSAQGAIREAWARGGPQFAGPWAGIGPGSTNSWDQWGQWVGQGAERWGEDFGRRIEGWGEDFGKNMEAWAENFGSRLDGNGPTR